MQTQIQIPELQSAVIRPTTKMIPDKVKKGYCNEKHYKHIPKIKKTAIYGFSGNVS